MERITDVGMGLQRKLEKQVYWQQLTCSSSGDGVIEGRRLYCVWCLSAKKNVWQSKQKAYMCRLWEVLRQHRLERGW